MLLLPLEKVNTKAKLISKSDIPYQNVGLGRGIPLSNPMYELIFETSSGSIIFSVSNFEFNVVDIGFEGSLVYEAYKHHNKLISFGEYIKPFSVD